VQETLEGRIEYDQRAIEANPNYAYAYVWLSRDLYYAGHYQASFAMLEKAISLDPLSVPAIGNYVTALIHRGQLGEAARQVEKLAQLNPGLYLRRKAVLAGLGGNEAAYALGTLDALLVDPDRSSYWRHLEESLARMNLGKETLSLRESTNWWALLLLGEHDQAISGLEQRIADDPDQLARTSMQARLGLTLAAAGDYDRAGPLLNEAWQSQNGQINAGGAFIPGHAIALIQVLRAVNQEEGVPELLAALRDYVARRKEAGITFTTQSTSVDYIEGITAYMSGQRETGISLITRAVEDGKFFWLRQAYLQALFDDPGFAPIMQRQLERQHREREKFLAVVCNDNPYSGLWQPEAGTCEQFLSESEAR
jgi:tetratricopeptide (TPR) repeat protein